MSRLSVVILDTPPTPNPPIEVSVCHLTRFFGLRCQPPGCQPVKMAAGSGAHAYACASRYGRWSSGCKISKCTVLWDTMCKYSRSSCANILLCPGIKPPGTRTRCANIMLPVQTGTLHISNSLWLGWLEQNVILNSPGNWA